MVKDYANNNSNNNPTPTKRRNRKWIALIIAVAIIIPLILYYFKYQQYIKSQPQAPATKTITKPKTTQPQVRQAKKTKASAPQFDFYTVLTKTQVKLPQTHGTVVSQSQASESNVKTRYVLQIAALRDNDDAKRLKKQLFKLGYPVFIQKYQTDNTLWYRVLSGPYKNATVAEQDQQRLAQQHQKSLLISLKAS